MRPDSAPFGSRGGAATRREEDHWRCGGALREGVFSEVEEQAYAFVHEAKVASVMSSSSRMARLAGCSSSAVPAAPRDRVRRRPLDITTLQLPFASRYFACGCGGRGLDVCLRRGSSRLAGLPLAARTADGAWASCRARPTRALTERYCV